jgi:hypothetical protein
MDGKLPRISRIVFETLITAGVAGGKAAVESDELSTGAGTDIGTTDPAVSVTGAAPPLSFDELGD